MKTLVCFKAIPDSGMLAGLDWEKVDNLSMDIRFVKRIFNCFDESALEMALTLCNPEKKADTVFDLTALTIDDQIGDFFLSHLLAVGYGTAVRIDTDTGIDLRFNAVAVSRLIASYVEKIGRQQLVILGIQGGEGDNRQTGPLVAEQLGWPCIRNVINIHSTASARNLKVVSRTEDGSMVQTITLPMVLVIGNSLNSPFLRVPTLRQRLDSRGKKIQVYTFKDLGVDGHRVAADDKTLIDLRQEKVREPCVFIDGTSAREKAQQVFDRYLKKVMTE